MLSPLLPRPSASAFQARRRWRRLRRRHPLGQGRLPFLRHWLRRAHRRQGRSRGGHPGRPRRASQQGPELHQGLLPVQDHVRQGPPHAAAAAHEGRQVRQERRVRTISWDKAFDIMEEKCKAALKAGGPRNIGMFGSGQWTIWEGYAAAKLFKAGFRSNNIDPNARHCMASAVAGFMRTFGIDEPMGCYDDMRARRRLRAVGLEHGRDAPHPVVAHHRPPPDGQACQAACAVDLRRTAPANWPTTS
jgi:hypothetical protein